MDIDDPELRESLKKLATVAVGGVTDELRPVFELMDAYGFFQIREGDDSPRRMAGQPLGVSSVG